MVGLFIALVGASIGIDQGMLRQGAALLLVGFGVLLLSPALQARFAVATARLGTSGNGVLARVPGRGWAGQFAVGCVLGLVWSPCVGPTLGATTTLASQGRHIGQIALLMLLFGLGAGTPLLLVGTLSHEAVSRLRGRMAAAGERGKWVLGAALLLLGLAILTGWDKTFEAWLVDHSPDWLTALTTRY